MVRLHPPPRRTGFGSLGIPKTQKATTPEVQQQILTRRSPREHRATGKRQRDLVATDFTVDQGLEAEQSTLPSQDDESRSRDWAERRNQWESNGEKAVTAVARD